MSLRDEEYKKMYGAYMKYEDEYWYWAEMRKAFNQDMREQKYYRRNNAPRRRKYAEKVIADYPHLAISGWDLKNQIGGAKEIVFSFGLTKWEYDLGGLVYEKLKQDPDLIYKAIEETYNWSIEIGVKTTQLAELIPHTIEFIATECIV